MTGFVNCSCRSKSNQFFSRKFRHNKNGIDRLQIVKDTQGKFNSYYIAKMLNAAMILSAVNRQAMAFTKTISLPMPVGASNNGTFCPITVDNAQLKQSKVSSAGNC